MEAMRLSLLDHEEHQRKEAEEKKKQEAAAAAASSAEGSGAAGPSTEAEGSQMAQGLGSSTLEAQSSSSLQASSSSNLSLSHSPTSNSGSPSPRHAKVGSQESLAPRKSWSLSRSRTPPPPANPIPNVPLSEENQAAWRNRTSGPPAFSTLNAALTSASTAAALLGPSSSSGQQPSRFATPEPNPADIPSSSSLPPEGSIPKTNLVEDTSIPTITVENNDGHSGTVTAVGAAPHSSADDTSSASPSASAVQGSHDVPGLNGAAEASYFESSITTPDSESEVVLGASPYMPLPSSPEADDPLLCLTKPTTKADGAVNGEQAGISTET